jgi:hypothetical protein
LDGEPDWLALFEGNRSAIDWPVAAFWSELAVYYPEAKVNVMGYPEWTNESQYPSAFATDIGPLSINSMLTASNVRFTAPPLLPFIGQATTSQQMPGSTNKRTQA